VQSVCPNCDQGAHCATPPEEEFARWSLTRGREAPCMARGWRENGKDRQQAEITQKSESVSDTCFHAGRPCSLPSCRRAPKSCLPALFLAALSSPRAAVLRSRASAEPGAYSRTSNFEQDACPSCIFHLVVEVPLRQHEAVVTHATLSASRIRLRRNVRAFRATAPLPRIPRLLQGQREIAKKFCGRYVNPRRAYLSRKRTHAIIIPTRDRDGERDSAYEANSR